MKKFPSLKYPITPIIDETTYVHFCEMVEELDDLTFEEEQEEEKNLLTLTH